MCPYAANTPGFDSVFVLFGSRLTKVEVDDMNNHVYPTDCNITVPLFYREAF